MKGFFSWFNSRTKIKRWMLLILVGVCFTCFAIATILTSKVLRPNEIVKIVISFVVGFTSIVIGFVFMQKRMLEILVEANNTATKKGQKAHKNIQGLIFNKTMYDEGPKVVVIGGGNGLNTVIKGLKKYTKNITAIVNMAEKGKTDHDLPYQEIKNSIIAFSDKEDLMRNLFNLNFTDSKLKNMNFGDIYLDAMQDIYQTPSMALKQSTETLNIPGQIIPSTIDETTVLAQLEDGTIVEGKQNIPEIAYNKISKIQRIYLSPSNCQPTPGVLDAISEADCIIIGPGSLYTEVLPNLLVKNISKTIKESKAIKIFITNLMTEPGQTDNYSISDHLQALFDHAGKEVIDYAIADTGEIVPEFVRKYNQDGQDLVLQDIDKATKKGIKVIHKNLSKIEGDYIRHDSDVIASTIMELICNDLKFRDKQSTPEYLWIDSILKEELKRERKESNRIKKQKIKESKSKHSGQKKRSKFNKKYSERIETIQTTVEKKNENQKLYKEMEKLDKKQNKGTKDVKTAKEAKATKTPKIGIGHVRGKRMEKSTKENKK